MTDDHFLQTAHHVLQSWGGRFCKQTLHTIRREQGSQAQLSLA